MKAVLSTIGKFHTFDLARQLDSRGALEAIYSGYPRFKLNNEGLAGNKVKTFPWLHGSYMALPRLRYWLGEGFTREWEYWDRVTFDAYVAATLPECDLFSGLSGSALMTGKKAKSRGIGYVCDRGSAHIRCQDDILKEEFDRWGMSFPGIDPRIVEREEAEYELADLITVPSTFALNSFVKYGVKREKMRLVPYGVNLSKFSQTAVPDRDCFDVLFVGGATLQKGVPYLLKAFQNLAHPRKTLTFVGSYTQSFIGQMKAQGLISDNVRFMGHVRQDLLKDWYSRSHVMVLPSVQEGLAMVQAQAMACGCPVIASENTGSRDLFSDGCEGYIVPIRMSDAITEKLQRLADDPDLRNRMSTSALSRVKSLGGWDAYGERMYSVFFELCS